MNSSSAQRWLAAAQRITPSRSFRIFTPFPLRTAQSITSRALTSLSSSAPVDTASNTLPKSQLAESASTSSIQPTTYIEPTLDTSVSTLLPLLRSQSSYYAQVSIQGHPYLVTPGDSVRLPFVLQDVELGDVIRLNCATVFGSRDYSLKAGATSRGEKQKFLDERLYVARATVVNVVYEPLRVKTRKYPRQRHTRHLFSKHSYTVLRISELRPASEEEWSSIEEDGVNQ
jgi:large subunit ribosomal protein L21